MALSEKHSLLRARTGQTPTQPLNARQLKLAMGVARGDTWSGAARAAGFSESSNVTAMHEDPRMQAVIAIERAKLEKVADMDRKKVMQGFLDAIEMAKLVADPTAMIKGWAEVAKMCGYYAPEKKLLEVSISAKRMVDKFETMSDEELLKYAEKDIIDVTPNETGEAPAGGSPDLRLGAPPG